MGFLLDRNLLADWTKDPTVPAPVEPVKAAAQPGAVREGFQGMYSRIFDMLRGRVNFQSLWVTPTKAAGAPIQTVNGIQIDFTGGRFLGLTAEQTEPQVRVFGGNANTSVNHDSLDSSWGLTGSAAGVGFKSGAASTRLDSKRLFFTGVPAAATTDAVDNSLHPETLPKGWVNLFLQVAAGVPTVTVNAGINIASAAVVDVAGVKYLRITWAKALASLNYAIAWEPRAIVGGGTYQPATAVKSSAYVDVTIINLATAPASRIDLTTDGSWSIAGAIFGRQA